MTAALSLGLSRGEAWFWSIHVRPSPAVVTWQRVQANQSSRFRTMLMSHHAWLGTMLHIHRSGSLQRANGQQPNSSHDGRGCAPSCCFCTQNDDGRQQQPCRCCSRDGILCERIAPPRRRLPPLALAKQKNWCQVSRTGAVVGWMDAAAKFSSNLLVASCARRPR